MTSSERIGKYELLKSLAVGGMAEIYLARQTGMQQFEKIVVIKKILPHLADQQRFVEMFLDEARLAARFNHPNIVQIYDLGQEGDAFFIAMEFVQGEDIKAIVRRCAKHRQRIPIEHVVKIFSGVLDGLHYAHSQRLLDDTQTGVIHRDVSPHNIIVSYQGAVKLVDFGIAKARSHISTTIPGRVKGKHAYMSPEQCQGLDLDGRSDVFSAGIVMYELLTWTRLFKRRHDLDTLKAVTSAEIKPLKDLRPEIDDELQAIVLRALQRDRSKRFQTAQEMQMALEDYLLTRGLKSNSVLLARYLEELFADRLKAMNKALEDAQAENLENAVLSSAQPDLVDFLDMFFAGSTGDSNRDSNSDSSEGSARAMMFGPEFTPSGDSASLRTTLPETQAQPPKSKHPTQPPRAPEPSKPISQAPPPRAPAGMEVLHIAPGRPRTPVREVSEPKRPSPRDQAPEQPVRASDPEPGGVPRPPSPDFLDSGPVGSPARVDPPDDLDAYQEEYMPAVKRGGKGFMLIAFLVLAGITFLLIFMFRDTTPSSDAPALGRVELISVPSGADVYFNDSRLPTQTPTEVDQVEPNIEHTLRVSLPRLPVWEKKFTLTDTRKPLVFKAILSQDAAQKAKVAGKPIIAGMDGQGLGSIRVVSKPAKALVYLDGISTTRRTPTTLKKVPAGLDHVILLELEGKDLAFARLKVEDGQTANVDLALEDGSPTAKGRVVVHIETEPEGATVNVNGYPLKKKTPALVSLIAAKPSEIEVEFKGHRSWVFVARPVPGLDLTYFSRLRKK